MNSSSRKVAAGFLKSSLGLFIVNTDSCKADLHIPYWENKVNGEMTLFSNGISVSEQTIAQIASALQLNEIKKDLTLPEGFLPMELDEVLVNYLITIEEQIRRHSGFFIRKLPWPMGKPFAVSITHDVDLTRKYAPKSLLFLLSTGKVREFFEGSLEFVPGRNRYWTFPELLHLYSQRNWKANFFFLARMWEGFSYRYNIRTKKFRNLFKRILENSHEIGLHSSKFAFDNPERIEKEKLLLEKILGNAVVGVRQHYLKLQFPLAWQYFQNAGFKYDSSSGSNELLGFRSKTSFPYKSFDLLTDDIYNLWEIPFSVMDYNWQNLPFSYDEKVDIFIRLTDQVKKCNGLLNILWHPSNLAEPGFLELWNSLINWLAGKIFYQNSLQNILEWWKKKDNVSIVSLSSEQKSLLLKIHSESALDDLTLEVVTDKMLDLTSNHHILTQIDKYKYHLVINRLLEGENDLIIGLK